jgi:hypothetical protein
MDLTTRLRAACGHDSRSVDGCTNCEAAEEIERLRANLKATESIAAKMEGHYAQQLAAARPMCPHEHAVNDWRLHGA